MLRVFLLAQCLLATGPATSQELQADELERLRAMLQQSGPDGREQRERAIEQLLMMANPAAHQLLKEQILRRNDPDGVRESVLMALQRHFLLGVPTQFGGAGTDDRLQILTGYFGALSSFWTVPDKTTGQAGASNAEPDPALAALRALARTVLQRVPSRELDAAARQLMASSDVPGQVAVLRCLADLQQVLFTSTIADYLESPELRVRDGARASLQMLTYEDDPIQTKAQFDVWYAGHGTMRYIDLVEAAARGGLRAPDRLRADLERARIDAARDVVKALVVPTTGVDWTSVQARTLVENVGVLDACLELLQQALATTLPSDENPTTRQAFCRGLMQRFKDVAPEMYRRRSLLLEVAAYLTRVEETDLCTEVSTLLLAQLDSPNIEARISALRGLRRTPTVEIRQRLVQFASALLPRANAVRAQLAAAVATLSSRTAPRWTAPLPSDPDRADWLALVASLCRTPADLELREPALVLAQTPDVKEQRVTEVFELLLSLAMEDSLDAKFRSNCLIHLQSWGSEEVHSDKWVSALYTLLADKAPELRLSAAESLSHLPEFTDKGRIGFIRNTFPPLRNRLCVEPDAQVFRALVGCLQACGREPQMPELAIGALKAALSELQTLPVPENKFRLEPMLQALSAIAANASADRGQWLTACGPLLTYGRRESLRNVIKSHAATGLANEIGNADAGTAERAREAMYVLIETALLKPPRPGWTETEELKSEARDVRTAFGALDKLDEPWRKDKPAHRLLRLEVDLAAGKYPDVVQRATAWLAPSNGSAPPTDQKMTPEERQRMQLLAAEAQLALSKPDLALHLVEDVAPEATPGLLDLKSRIARALVAADLPRAVQLFDRVWRATAVEDPSFRQRLVDWMQSRLRQEPGARDEVVRESDKYAESFAAPECDAALRETFERLRASR